MPLALSFFEIRAIHRVLKNAQLICGNLSYIAKEVTSLELPRFVSATEIKPRVETVICEVYCLVQL